MFTVLLSRMIMKERQTTKVILASIAIVIIVCVLFFTACLRKRYGYVMKLNSDIIFLTDTVLIHMYLSVDMSLYVYMLVFRCIYPSCP